MHPAEIETSNRSNAAHLFWISDAPKTKPPEGHAGRLRGLTRSRRPKANRIAHRQRKTHKTNEAVLDSNSVRQVGPPRYTPFSTQELRAARSDEGVSVAKPQSTFRGYGSPESPSTSRFSRVSCPDSGRDYIKNWPCKLGCWTAGPSFCHVCTHGSFLIRRQRGHPGVVLPLVISNPANH